jgi:hypothetical protein
VCAVSSAVEHYLDMVGVTGSIPVPRTIFLPRLCAISYSATVRIMPNTSPITRFALEQHQGPYETWPSTSLLYVDGVASGLKLPGYQLRYQFEVADGFLLVTDFDCPYEETTCFILLSRQMKVLARRRIGAMYNSFLVDKIEWTHDDEMIATFCTDVPWRIQIKRPRFSVMGWRITADPV